MKYCVVESWQQLAEWGLWVGEEILKPLNAPLDMFTLHLFIMGKR